MNALTCSRKIFVPAIALVLTAFWSEPAGAEEAAPIASLYECLGGVYAIATVVDEKEKS